MFLSKSLWGISDGSMQSSLVVIGYLPVNSEYEMFSCFILFRISELQLKLPVVGFLCSVLPRWCFGTHWDENMIHLEKLHHSLTRIFWSLIRMEILWYDSSSFCYSIFNGCKNEFFCMRITECISYNLFCKVIQDSSKIEMNSSVDDMSKITSPNNMRMNRTEWLEMIHYLDSSNIFPMHIILFLISRFDEASSFLHESRYAILLHESSWFIHWPTKCPSDTSMSIPWMFFMNNIQFLFFIQISYIHLRVPPEWWSGNREYSREDTVSYPMCGTIIIFLVYLSHEVGLLHLFFSLAQLQCWVIR